MGNSVSLKYEVADKSSLVEGVGFTKLQAKGATAYYSYSSYFTLTDYDSTEHKWIEISGNETSKFTSGTLIKLVETNTDLNDDNIIIIECTVKVSSYDGSKTTIILEEAQPSILDQSITEIKVCDPTSILGASTAVGNNSVAVASGEFSYSVNGLATGIGSYSRGFPSMAKGDYSTAIGGSCKTTGTYSTALGISSEAREYGAFASGWGSDALGIAAAAFNSSTASGQYSFSVNHSTASGDSSFAANSSTASAINSFAIGINNEASAEGSFVGGEDNIASGLKSFSFQSSDSTKGAKASNSVVLGGMSNDIEVSHVLATMIGTRYRTSKAADTTHTENIYAFGSIKGKIPIETIVTTNTTIDDTHINSYIPVESAIAVTITIPVQTMEKGDNITIEQRGAGQVTAAIASGTDQWIYSKNKTAVQYESITVICIDDTVGAEKYTVQRGIA